MPALNYAEAYAQALAQAYPWGKKRDDRICWE